MTRGAGRRGWAILLTTIVALLVGAPAANAHPTLLFTDPATDTANAVSPERITLVLNEAVTAGGNALTLVDPAGKVLSLGPTTTARAGHAVTAPLRQPLPAGVYRVRWQVNGSDGDFVGAEFRFAVGSAVLAATASTAGSTLWAVAALRWLLFAGLALAVGGVLAGRLIRSATPDRSALPPVRSLVPLGTLSGLIAAAGLSVLLVADTGSLRSLWSGPAGGVLVVEALGLSLAFAIWRFARPAWRVLTIAPVAAVLIAEGWRSHANVTVPVWGGLLAGIHLTAAATWAGALAQVVVAAIAWRQSKGSLRTLFANYARLAVWVFATVVVTGALSALVLVPLAAWTDTTYGRLLLVKVGLVLVVAGLALTARFALHRRQLARLRGLTHFEAAGLALVLAMSAALVSTTPAGSTPPAPPAPHGQVVQLATMAGQIGITIQASDRQVVVRLTSPRVGDYYTGEERQAFTLSGQITTPGRVTTSLELTECGPGCFVASADWEPGDNILGLRAGADHWRGDTVSMLVPWPGRSAGAQLQRAVSALRAVKHLTVYEAVTSDMTRGLPDPQPLEMTGRFFVGQEPYADGTAPVVAQISRPGQPVRLALGYPAANVSVTLTLDASGRISEETLTDETHLIQRRFVYSEHK